MAKITSTVKMVLEGLVICEDVARNFKEKPMVIEISKFFFAREQDKMIESEGDLLRTFLTIGGCRNIFKLLKLNRNRKKK